MLIVICGTGPDEYIAQRKVSDCTWDETVKDIARGEWKDISDVLHGGLDVSILDHIAREVADIWAERNEGLKGWERDFIEQTLGIQVANRFRQMEDA